MTTPAACLPYVGKAVTYICDTLAVGLSAAQAQALWADPAVCAAEKAVDAAALAGSLPLTKFHCQRWWLATLDVLVPMARADATLQPRIAGWERVRTAITSQMPTSLEGGIV